MHHLTLSNRVGGPGKRRVSGINESFIVQLKETVLVLNFLQCHFIAGRIEHVLLDPLHLHHPQRLLEENRSGRGPPGY